MIPSGQPSAASFPKFNPCINVVATHSSSDLSRLCRQGHRRQSQKKTIPTRLLYHLDAAGMSQGIEFTPEGDRLFLGSCSHGRIEVYDVVGDFGLRKNPMFIKVGSGHNSLSIGPRFHHTRSLEQADSFQVSRC